MRLFKSKEANLVHYVTGVTYNRFPIFRDDYACALFIDALATTRLKEPFKLIGYVIMPDHFHLLVNPLWFDISLIIGRLKGRAASLILKWLRAGEYSACLTEAAIGAAIGLWPDSRRLVAGLFSNRHLESQVHSSET